MCQGDFDCPSNLQCLPGILPWAPPGTNFTFCDCNAISTGFLKATPTAEECSVIGPQTVYLIVVNATLSTCALVLLLQAFMILGKLKRTKDMVLNDVVITILLLTFTNFFDFSFAFINTVAYFQPLEHVQNVNGMKAHPLQTVSSSFVIIGQSMGLIAYSNLPLAWAEIVFRTKTFNLNGKAAWKIRAGVRFYQLMVLVTRLAVLGVEGRDAVPLATGVAILGVVGVIIIFVVARRWFVLLFKTTSVRLSESSILRRINVLTNTVVTATSMATITVTVYFVLVSQGANLKCIKGEICSPFLLRDFAGYAFFVVKAACQHYCVLSLGFSGCTHIGTFSSTGASKHERTGSVPNRTEDYSTKTGSGTTGKAEAVVCRNADSML